MTAGASFRSARRIELLHRNHLDVIRGGKAAPQPRHSVGGQHMIRARRIIARRFRAERAHENTSRMADLRNQFFMVNREMLRREAIGKLHRLIERIAPK